MKNSNQWLFPALTLGLMALSAAFLSYWKLNQKLGKPGVHVVELDEKGKLAFSFPEALSGYSGREIPVTDGVIEALPADTTIDIRLYKGTDGFEMQLQGVLMGTDRTSIHQPQFCLTGIGFNIKDSIIDTIRIESEEPYELPVMVLRSEKEFQGRTYTGYYIYWFVADGLTTPKHGERMWWMAKGLFTTGELQRWAYVSCLAVCDPAIEEVTLARMKSFLAEAIPTFQSRPAMLATSGNNGETASLAGDSSQNTLLESISRDAL